MLMDALVSPSVRINARDIDLSLGNVTVSGGRPVALRPQTLSVLALLVEKSGALVSKEELVERVWPGIAVTDDSLVQCITELRRALGDDAHTIIKTVPKRGYVLSSELRSSVPLHQPCIAVLPFVNMSGDPSRDYYGEGMAEDIITMLACFPWIRVASRTSSFAYNKPANVRQVGRDLGVHYVLEGSVRDAGGKVRITAQLIDAESGDHVWADRFDEEGGDIAALQDAVGHKIYQTVAGLQGQVMEKERAGAWGKSGPGIEEYDYVLRGYGLFLRFEREAHFKALSIWQEGLSRFPDSALLKIKVAWGHTMPLFYGWTGDRAAFLEIAWRLGKEVEEQQDKSRLVSFLCHWKMAVLYYLYEGDFEHSVAEAEAAAKVIPYDWLARAQLAFFLSAAGRNDLAIDWLEEAIRRDSHPTDLYFLNLAVAYYNEGRPADALTLLGNFKGPLRGPKKIILAAANARLGRIDEARHELARFLAEFPGWTIEKEATWPGGRHPKFVEPLLTPYLDDLRKAGLPER
jgi:adenylate cyclase